MKVNMYQKRNAETLLMQLLDKQINVVVVTKE